MMTQKLTIILLTLFLLASAQEVLTLDAAISEGMKFIGSKLPAGTRVTVINIESGNRQLSEYITDESNIAITNSTKLSLVKDETKAQSVISGSISRLGDNYRFRIEATNVANAEVQAVQSFRVKSDDVLTDLLRRPGALPVTPKPVATQTPAPEQKPEPVQEVKPVEVVAPVQGPAPAPAFARQTHVTDSHIITYEKMAVGGTDNKDTTFDITVTLRRTQPAQTQTQAQPAYSSVAASIPETREAMRGVGLFAMRYETSYGLAVVSRGGTIEFGGIGKGGVYFTGTGNIGNNGGGGGINLGGIVGGEKAAKSVFGFTAGFWRNSVYVFSLSDYNSGYYYYGDRYDEGFAGGFWKFLLGNKNVNFDITNRLLFGAGRRLDTRYDDWYDQDITRSTFSLMWQVGAGLTFTGNGK